MNPEQSSLVIAGLVVAAQALVVLVAIGLAVGWIAKKLRK